MSQTVNEKKKAFLDKELNFSIAAHLFTMMRFDNAKAVKKYIQAYRLSFKEDW